MTYTIPLSPSPASIASPQMGTLKHELGSMQAGADALK